MPCWSKPSPKCFITSNSRMPHCWSPLATPVMLSELMVTLPQMSLGGRDLFVSPVLDSLLYLTPLTDPSDMLDSLSWENSS